MKLDPIRSFLLLCCIPLLFFVGCATTPPLQPITEPGKRWQFNGFSVVSPGSAGWNWVGREGQITERFFSVTYVKQISPATALAKAEAKNLGAKRFANAQELLQFVKSSNIMQEGPRQKNVKKSFWPDRTTNDICVRWTFEAEDDGVPGWYGTLFVVDDRGVACVHPKHKDVLVIALVSRRTPKGQQLISNDLEGEQFISSLRMSEFTQ